MTCMMHEPFYTSTGHADEKLGVWAGSVAHKGSFADRGPIWNETKDICLIFSGEIFNHQTELASLVRMYQEKGTAFLERLNGWFSGVLLDLRRGEVILFNDRYGVGRVYWCETPNGFFFSSEAKSILSVVRATRELNTQGLAESLSCGCALQNRTLYKGISLLPGASRWIFRKGEAVRKESYFARESWESQERLEDDLFYLRLRDTLTRIVPEYLTAGAKIGISLTGGLDSRVLLAAAASDGRKLPCYTFGGMYRECADALLARQLAKACGLPHEIIRVDRAFLAEFQDLAKQSVFVSDGAMDVTGSVELYANRLAREIAPIRVTGNYGSEILRGNVAFGPRMWGWDVLSEELRSAMERAAQTYAEEARGHRLSFIAFKQVPWHHCSRLSLEQCQLTPRSPFLDNELVKLSYRASAVMTASSEPMLRFVADNNRALARIPTDRGFTYPSVPAVSQVRRLCREFTAKAENAFDGNMPQWLASLNRVFGIEKYFIGRNRFYHFRPWFRDELAGSVKEILLDERTLQRPYVSRRGVEKIVRAHTDGRENHAFAITRLLTTELIERELVERNWKSPA